MLYFIPSWYVDGKWSEQEQRWYTVRKHTEFDDTVKYIQLFHRNYIYPFQVMLFNYAPNFRHFLHRQSILRVPYWSCFDAMQCVERKKVSVLSFHNLKWPQGIEFVYTMFIVIAMLNGKKYAQIYFGEDGNLIEIEMYDGDQLIRKNIYDDRGFLSSSILYRDEVPHYQDYLGEDGKWRVRHIFEDDHLLINPKYAQFRIEHGDSVEMVPFSKKVYSNMEEILGEIFTAYLRLNDDNDLFCAAMHPIHMPMIQRVLGNKRLILTVFQERNDLTEDIEFLRSLDAARYVICDSSECQQRLAEILQDKMPPSCIITPFDTRPDFGISQQFTVQKILMPVDKLEPELFDRQVTLLAQYLLENEGAEVYLFTRDPQYGTDRKLLERVHQCLEQFCQREEFSQVKDLSGRLAVHYFAVQCMDELSVSKCLREQRLIVDFRQSTDIYLRIIAISMGIPQIVLFPSEFIASGKNGIVLEKPESLGWALTYYLGELANWNEAMVNAYEFGKQFDTAKQIANWKGVIDFFGADTDTTVGK